MEACLSWPADVTGIVDILATYACDQEGRRSFVFVKTNDFEADARQYAIMRARMTKNCQEVPEIIEYMNAKQKGLLATTGESEH